MPRFFFDTYRNGLVVTDEIGHEVEDESEARCDALHTVAEMAVTEMALRKGGDHQSLFVIVRAEDGDIIYTATLTVVGLTINKVVKAS